MEPVESRLFGADLAPPMTGAIAPVAAPRAWPTPTPGTHAPGTIALGASAVPTTSTLPMARWRVLGALLLLGAFGLIGWQVQRLVTDQLWSDSIMWMSIVAAVLAAICVLVWTWVATENARRLIGPATGRELPDPRAAVMTWFVPFGFVALAIGVVAYLADQVEVGADQTIAAIPLAIAVISLLLAIPLSYRPLSYLAGVVRQLGGYSVRVAQWMWVPVVLAVVGLGSILVMRFAIDAEADPPDMAAATSSAGWAPLWVIAIVAIAPCLIVVLLAWRSASSVEDAISHATRRRQPGRTLVSPSADPDRNQQRTSGPNRVRVTANNANRRVRQLPGADLLRLGVATLLAGLALLSIVGAAVMVLAWSDSKNGRLLPADQRQAWDTIDLLRHMSRLVTMVLLATMVAWTFVAVTNVRLASGRRSNPVIAAAAWPAAAIGIWQIADRMIIDQSVGRVVLGFAAQAVVLAIPFLVLERAADTIGARRTPIRIAYTFGVVLLVHIEGLGGLTTIHETTDASDLARLAGYLAIGALVQLMSTMAVTEACRSITRATRHEAEHHNMLVDQRAARPIAATPQPS